MSTPKLTVGSVALKVTPDMLVTKADEVLADIASISQNLATIKEKIEGTSGYWIGEAGELNRQLYTAQQEDIDTMMRRLNEHPVDLKTIAGNYTSVENQVTAAANALTDNVII